MTRFTKLFIVALASPFACVVDVAGDDEAVSGGDDNGSTVRHCDANDGSITLPPGFCATVFADQVGKARHIAVSPGGIVFVALAGDEGDDAGSFGVLALADDDDDGVADRTRRFADGHGNGIAWHEGHLYFARNDSIVRWAMEDGELAPHSHEEVLVSGLPDDGDHTAKSIVIGDDGSMFVNIGSASNACQIDNREPGSPGVDPCPELAVLAGIWRFPTEAGEQTADDGEQWAIGIRNANAMAIHPVTRRIVALQNGRDQLFDNWPTLFDDADDDRLPSEELLLVQQGHDYGWPYCFHDPDLGEMVLAPEYGGDGSDIGRCAEVDAPDAWFPAHWAPLGIHFYGGAMFPDRYRQGAFVTFHGSRFEPAATGQLPGYDVAFVPFQNGKPSGEHMIFADDFAGGARPLPDKAEHRPVGLAEAPDGSLYIGDDQGGRIWRVYYDLGRTP